MPTLIKIVTGAVVTGLIAWGAWATTTITNATPRPIHDRDVRDLRNEQMQQNEKMIDRLEKIWEKVQ